MLNNSVRIIGRQCGAQVSCNSTYRRNVRTRTELINVFSIQSGKYNLYDFNRTAL